MFWDIFFKKSSDKDDEQKEYIDIIDDKGKKVSVDKKIWLKRMKEKLDENKNNITKECDILETAIGYGLSLDVVEYCMKLYNENKSNQRCVDLIFQCYMNNNMYKEAVEVYETYLNAGYPFNYAMYYDLAIAQEKNRDYKSMEKNLFMSFTNNNNYIKAIDKLKDYMKGQGDDFYYEWLSNLAQNSKSWYLYMELAKVEYDRGNLDEGIKNLLKSLDLHTSDKHILKVANILLSNKRYTEFENYIIPKYDVNSDNINLHQAVLNFYFKDNQCDKGLELLHKLYLNNIQNEFFADYEKQFLKKKLKIENPSKYDSMINEKGWGKLKSIGIKGPLNTLLFKTTQVNRTGKSVLLLPFELNSSIRVPEKVKDFSKNIHIFLNERISLLTNLRNMALFMYDDLGTYVCRKPYSDEYFAKIKESNPKLDMVLTGQVKVLDENGTFEFKIFTYDLNEKQKVDRFIIKTSSEVYNQVISKFFNTTLKVLSETNGESVEITDKRFMEYYTDYIDIVLNVNKYNEYRIYETDRVLKYCLNYCTENKISMALSLIYKQSKVLPEVKEKYKQIIYNEIAKGTYKEEIVKQFNLVYGENKDENNIETNEGN